MAIDPLHSAVFSGRTPRTRREGLGLTVAASVWGAAIAGADFYSAVLRSTMLMRSTSDRSL